jgi:hypothetical protein
MQATLLRYQQKSYLRMMYAASVQDDTQNGSRMQFWTAFASLALLAFIGALDAPLLAPALPVRQSHATVDQTKN